jgi:hypothetical protein
MFIPDPNFFFPGSQIQIQRDSWIPDPESKGFSGSRIRIRIRIKEFKYFNSKNCFQALRNTNQIVHSGSGSRCQKDTGSRIRNTANNYMKVVNEVPEDVAVDGRMGMLFVSSAGETKAGLLS